MHMRRELRLGKIDAAIMNFFTQVTPRPLDRTIYENRQSSQETNELFMISIG